MKNANDSRRKSLTAIAVPVLALSAPWGMAPRAFGDIRGFDGRVRTLVQQRLDGAPSSVDQQEDAYDFTLNPTDELSAAARLQISDLDGAILASARGLAFLVDPTLSTMSNPGDFSLEWGGFSNSARIAFDLTAEAVEGREVEFGFPELGNAVIGAGGARVRSSIFVEGALAFWSPAPARGLVGTRAEVVVSVTARRSGSAETIYSERLAFEAKEESGVQLVDRERAGGDRALQFEILDLEELRALALSRGEGSDLAQSIVIQLDDLGLEVFTLVFISLQEIRYAYSANLFERQRLEAQWTATAAVPAAGAGVAGVMGRPFENLSDLLQDSVSGVEASVIEEAVNALAVVRRGAMGAEDLSGEAAGAGMADDGAPPPAARSPGWCGAFGSESLTLALFLPFLSVCACRRDAGRASRPG